MSLEPGARFGSYEIIGALGAGGMGEVYRARDTQLERAVALKILPAAFAADPDRLMRFSREAKTLASLNHPHVAAIYGIESGALVMELVEGEDLSAQIARGPIPAAEALAIARQIAEALEAAHEHGIVHRDLKPANIKVRADGTVKVLDFGLAKAVAAGSDAAQGFDAANSPTFTSPAMLTSLGIIIGTAAYMAPEQAKGKVVDRRADLWAFGVVLFEMLTGRMAFDGETITDVLAAVVTRDPDWTQLPAATPAGIRRLLARCLTRDPRRRLADAGEARHQIDEALAAPAEPAAPPMVLAPRRSLTGVLPWAITVVLAGAVAWLAWRSRAPEPLPLRYAVEIPPKTTLSLSSRPAIALSPDGTTLAYAGVSGGTARIYIRGRSEFESHPIEGTDGASEPVFSPDGHWIAFFANNKLNKVPLTGGSVEPIADVNDPRGLVWHAPDVITYSPESVGGVFEIAPSAGAARKALTTLSKGTERTHRWPYRLANGVVLFTVGSMNSPDNYDTATIEAWLPKTGERKVVLRGAAMARYVPGYLLFVREASLFAVPFDADRLEVTGTPTAIVKRVAGDSTTGAANFDEAAGTFAYVPAASETTLHRLVWMDRNGRPEPLDLPPGQYFDVSVSPDGSRAAMTVAGSGGRDVWVYGFARKTFTRLTFASSQRTPIWAADGSSVYSVKVAPDANAVDIIRKPANGSRAEERLTTLKLLPFLRGVTPDGRELLMDYATATNKTDVAIFDLQDAAKAVPVVATPFDEYAAKWSPDRRFVAYQSDESSRAEIYVREASGRGGRWQVSTEGGEEPRWSPDGRELFYRAGTQMMSAAIELSPTFSSGTPRLLFDGLHDLRVESGNSYDIDPKGGRFLTIRLADDAAPPAVIRVALDWRAELARLAQSR